MKNNKSIKVSVWKVAIICSIVSLLLSLSLVYLYTLRTRHIEMICQIVSLDMENRLINYNCVEKEK